MYLLLILLHQHHLLLLLLLLWSALHNHPAWLHPHPRLHHHPRLHVMNRARQRARARRRARAGRGTGTGERALGRWGVEALGGEATNDVRHVMNGGVDALPPPPPLPG